MPTKTPQKILNITPKGKHDYDKDMDYYYILYYSSDINYAKDSRHFYNIWTRMEKEWGELPTSIERVDCSEREYRDTFGMETDPARIARMEG